MFQKLEKILLVTVLVLLAGQTNAWAEKSVGVIMSGDLSRYQEAHKAFVSALSRAGYDQGKVTIYVQTPNPDLMSWTNAVRKFVGVGVDCLVTYGGGAAMAAVKETTSIPVVFSYIYDPGASGVKKQNSTGVSAKVPMITLLKTLKSIKPCSKLAVVYNPDERDSVAQMEEAEKHGAGLGIQVIAVAVKTSADVKSRVPRALESSDSVFITNSAVAGREAGGIVASANKRSQPAISQASGMTEKGALIALAPSSSEQGEIAAAQVARVLRGDPPSGIALENARRVDLVLNLKAANVLGLKVPFDVLNAATKVIK
jgi:putative tryptophan/tyrosine transport system substrate-binding protein